MPNLVSPTHPSHQIMGKSQTGVFLISISRIHNNINMKHVPVTKFDKRNATMSKKINDDVSQQIMTSLSFF